MDLFTMTEYNVLNMLLHADDWVSMKELANILGYTERQVRKEIQTIRNDDRIDYVILSGAKGYKIAAKNEHNNMMMNRAVSAIKSAVAIDYTSLLTFYKVLNELKRQHPALHNQIDIENGVVKRYAE